MKRPCHQGRRTRRATRPSPPLRTGPCRRCSKRRATEKSYGLPSPHMREHAALDENRRGNDTTSSASALTHNATIFLRSSALKRAPGSSACRRSSSCSTLMSPSPQESESNSCFMRTSRESTVVLDPKLRDRATGLRRQAASDAWQCDGRLRAPRPQIAGTTPAPLCAHRSRDLTLRECPTRANTWRFRRAAILSGGWM